MSTILNKALIYEPIKNHFSLKSDTTLARFLDIKPQNLSSWIFRNTFDIDLVHSKCVDIDADFLITGEDPIFKNNLSEPNLVIRQLKTDRIIENQDITLFDVQVAVGIVELVGPQNQQHQTVESPINSIKALALVKSLIRINSRM